MMVFMLALLALAPRVLLITGQNNHDWERTSAHLEAILNEGSEFELTVLQTPSKGEPWQDWAPDFVSYDVVLLVYNGEFWPAPVRSAFEAYIAGGGTALVQHAANNPFPGWEAYEQMVGLLWRGPAAGYRVFMDADGSLVRLAPGEDIGAGHGRLHDWQITSREASHPILQGLPAQWMHPHDELYHGQRGPAEDMHILATAYSSPEHGGSGRHEPMLWWIPYGDGKVLTFLPGHLWAGQNDDRALRCVGFRTLVRRGVEWLATGSVSLPVPDDFPTADSVRVRP